MRPKLPPYPEPLTELSSAVLEGGSGGCSRPRVFGFFDLNTLGHALHGREVEKLLAVSREDFAGHGKDGV